MQRGRYVQNKELYRSTIRKIQTGLLRWGEKNLRNYPWRTTSDPYKIIVAEVMLHRTGVVQVEKVYSKFIEKYPDFKSIVMVGEDKIESDLHSLGLRNRSYLLYKMAREVTEKYIGTLPAEKDKLVGLPGVGHYIASAVLCSIYDIPEPVLDTNTLRVIGRVFGIEVTESSRRSEKFRKIMRDMIGCSEPRKFFFSIVDFASTVCTASYPKCNTCPLNDVCYFYGANLYERKIN